MGEIVLVRLNKKFTLCEHISDSYDGKSSIIKRVKKEFKIPSKVIFVRTNIDISSSEELIEFNEKCSLLSQSINLNLIWETINTLQQSITTSEIALLYFGKKVTPVHIIAIMLSIDNDPTYFEYTKGADIKIQSIEDVESMIQKQHQTQLRNQTEQKIVTSIQNGDPIGPLNELETEIFLHIKKFALQGRQYNRSAYVLSIFDKTNSIKEAELQKIIFQNLTKSGSLSEDYPSEVVQSKIPTRFHNSIFSEIRNLAPIDTYAIDLSNMDTYTIDDETTKDIDDAFSLDGDTAWIHITDIANIVPKNSALDQEAFNRSSTLYMPEGIIPMLPRAISEKIGSIKPNEPRQCLSLKLKTNSHGEILDATFHTTLIKSNKSINYKEANHILENPKHSLHNVFSKIQKITESCRKTRYQKGSFELFNRNELKIKIALSGKVSIEVIKSGSPSNDLIAELMITYNCQVAEFLKSHNAPAAYRIQKSPDPDKLNQIPDTLVGNYMAIKLLRPSVYSRSPGWHFGLGVGGYTQASSPLRRYSDLCIQRQMIHFIKTGESQYSETEIMSICHSVETQKKNLSRIEKSRNRYWFLKYLKENYILNKKPALEAIALEDGSDTRTSFELIKYPYRGKCIFNHTIKSGQIINITLSGVDLWERKAQFSYLE